MGSGKNKIANRVNYISRKEYNNFKEKHPTADVSYNEYITILKASTSEIREHILKNPLGFKLPYNLGYLVIKKFKTNTKFVAVDWVNTRKLGKLIPLTNFHSFGNAFRLEIFRNKRIKPLAVYKFTAHRIMKRMSAKIIKSGKAPYIEIDKNYFTKRFDIENYLKDK
jgi:hypothetical protein